LIAAWPRQLPGVEIARAPRMLRASSVSRFGAVAFALAFLTIALVTPLAHRSSVPAHSAAPLASSLVFERNDGQHPDSIRYAARGAGYRMSALDDGVVLSLSTAGGAAQLATRFDGGRAGVVPEGEVPATARVNYFVGRDPHRWRQNVPTFGRIRYPRVFDGIDVVFYGSNRQLEYDVVVAPDARPDTARLRFDGARSVRVEPDGALTLALPHGELQYTKPAAYQLKNGERQPVAMAYRLDGDVVTFDAGDYDRSRELIIDPVLVFSTYLGGSSVDSVQGVAVDAEGATYAAGGTFSDDFPTSPGTRPKSFSNDAFITKLDRRGALVYSTYFGGSNEDGAVAIAVDAAGAAYVTGWTESLDLPVSSTAFQRQSGGGDDVFVLKLAPAGNRIAYATYLGGDEDEPFISIRAGIAVDPTGIATVVSSTDSTNFPTTSGAFVRTSPGFRETGFVTRLNATGSALIFSTLLGGENVQGATGVALDAQGRAIVVGYAEGAMPTTKTIGPGGSRDAYALKLNATGSALVFSTRFGGSGTDAAEAVTYDPNRDVAFISGTTGSTDFPVSPPATLKGDRDAFLFTITSNGSGGFYSALAGGSQSEQGFGIGSSGDHITLFGTTLSPDFPTVNPLQAFGGSADAFVTRFWGARPMFSTTIGGSGGDDATAGGVVDGAGAATIGGSTSSTNFPLAHAAQSSNHGGSTDGFVTRVAMAPRGTPGPHDVVVHPAQVATLHGDWNTFPDPTAADGLSVRNPDRGRAKVETPLAAPTDYFEFTVHGLSGGPYRLWMRGQSEDDSFTRDSVWVQFERAQNAASDADNEHDIFRIGTTEAMAVVIEDCKGCGLLRWGWQDGGYGQKLLGTPLYFNDQSDITVRVQRREDGIFIDQIVFAKEDAGEGPYFDAAPGYQKNDDTILPAQGAVAGGDIVIRANDIATLRGTWVRQSDATAADGVKVRNPDAGAPKLTTPLANPANYIEHFLPTRAHVAYRLWIRGRADNDFYGNDSAYVQFSDSVDSAGTPIWRSGTTSAATYVLEDCNGCDVQGWGWNDNGYGSGVLGPLVYFESDGPHSIRIQTREDGLSIDQIILSPERYLTTAPGKTKNDTTIVPR
jgi:hypothetical protein